MKTSVNGNTRVIREMARKGRKTKSHGSYRAKRKPTSPRLRVC